MSHHHWHGGECESAKHGPGTVPGNRVTGAEAHTEFRENITTRRYTPEVGAVSPNRDRTDLCGGREVTRVPTSKVALQGSHLRVGPHPDSRAARERQIARPT